MSIKVGPNVTDGNAGYVCVIVHRRLRSGTPSPPPAPTGGIIAGVAHRAAGVRGQHVFLRERGTAVLLNPWDCSQAAHRKNTTLQSRVLQLKTSGPRVGFEGVSLLFRRASSAHTDGFCSVCRGKQDRRGRLTASGDRERGCLFSDSERARQGSRVRKWVRQRRKWSE